MNVDLAAEVLDPVQYEIFAHRLWAIGEEGRVALQRVSASPIVVQGGECMQSFYDAEGRMVLACSGHLRFAAVTSDAIRKVLEWFGDSPGLYDGDQIFFNDPYVASSHTYDQMVIKPIFHEGRLIGWTASSSHTADTGGVLRGAATEIYHEGIRILGLKVVERGVFRVDVCKTIVEQCRDPHYVELDLRSRIAGNNVAGKRFGELVDRFGVAFVEAACRKIVEDAERQARAKLRVLPDGTWRSRMYGSGGRSPSGRPEEYQILCRMTKRDDEVLFDFAGTSGQMHSEHNSTLPSTMAHIALTLTNMLFWDVPWSDGKMVPVRIAIPEGTILNCRFPAACGAGPSVGSVLVAAVHECVAKMLYAGGRVEDVNGGWQGSWYAGGPGFFYGGHDRHGVPVAQGLYDLHGSGFGASPLRDGVDTAGHVNIPSGGISDVERIEMQYPFLYLTRNHSPNGAGYGRFRGGDGSHRVLIVYGSQDLTVNFPPYVGVPHGFGLFGGYPVGSGGMRALYRTDPNTVQTRMAAGDYPVSPREILEGGWGEVFLAPGGRPRVPVPEWWLISDFVPGGGGFGDPLDREPDAVARDVAHGIYTPWAAERFFGVVVDDAGAPSLAATTRLRHDLRTERLAAGEPPDPAHGRRAETVSGEAVHQPHAYLEVVRTADGYLWRCRRCGAALGAAEGNYKRAALLWKQELTERGEYPLPHGEPFAAEYQGWVCPGCGTLLQVDVFSAEVGGEPVVWDIEWRPGGAG